MQNDQNQTPAESESGSFSSTSSENQENQETQNMATIDNNQSNNHNALLPSAVKIPAPQSRQSDGWKSTKGKTAVSPQAAKTVIESRVLPPNIYRPGNKKVMSLGAGFASNTVPGPANIVELGRALRDDPDLIYEWVFNNVENHPTYGLQKGALGAVIDGVGNSFDQSDLLVQLFRQAGLTANYVNGTLRMNAAQAATWLCTNPADI